MHRPTTALRVVADPARVGVYGWSYGGYMTLMCLAQEPDLFRAVGHQPRSSHTKHVLTKRSMTTQGATRIATASPTPRAA